ncbi:hypothetical protein JCM6882_005905 [Rhodosporidiobolus microsporus]
MQRFRRKSESKSRSTKAKGKEREGSPASSSERSTASSGAAMARSPSGSLLPEPSDFRTSLILPQMMKRFSLLRGADGQLVDMATMQNHLAQQRQTGRLTAYEVDAVLAQYRLQSQYESAQPLPPQPKRKRIDWSKIQQGGGIDEAGEEASSAYGGNDSMRTSFATTSEDHTSHSMAPSPFSPSPNGSVTSFPTSSSPASGSPNPSSQHSNAGSTTNYSYQFTRRGPSNSVFGGRTHDARGIKMLKSGSSQSIASLGGGSVRSVGSRKGSVVEGAEKEEQASAAEGEVASPAVTDPEAQGSPHDAFEDAEERPDSPSSTCDIPPSSSSTTIAAASTATAPTPCLDVPELSTKQLRRISHALDNIEIELSKTFAKLASEALAEDEDDEGEAERARRRLELGEAAEEADGEGEKNGGERAEEPESEDEEVVQAATNGHELSSPIVDSPAPVSEVSKEAVRAMADGGLRLDVPLDEDLDALPQDSNSPISPTSPVNDSDLRGLSTFNIPSPTLLRSDFSDEAAPASPALSDTEPVDPFYARLQTQAAKVPLPPSVASSSPSLSVSAAASPALPPSSASSSPFLAHSASSSPYLSHSPSLSARAPSLRAPSIREPSPAASPATIPRSASISSHLDDRAASPLPPPSETAPAPPSPTPSGLASLSIPPRPSRVRELSIETDDTATATPSGSTPNTPAAYSFPVVPSRADSSVTARPGTGRSENSEVEVDASFAEDAASDAQEEISSLSPKGGEGELTMTDEGPFDLSLGGIRLPSAAPEEEEEEEDDEDDEDDDVDALRNGADEEEAEDEPTMAMPAPLEASPRQRTKSAASAFSGGSSFHGPQTVVDSDEEELVLDNAASLLSRYSIPSSRPQSLPSHPAPSSDSDDASTAHLRPMSVPLDRRPSNELLQVLAAASRSESGEASSIGEADSDIVLEDLLALQDSLVRAAARRAARLASNDSSEGGVALATPSSIASSNMAEPFNLSAVAAFARTPHPEGESPRTRKSIAEATPLPPAELSAQLAGLGLTSLAPFDLSQPSSSSQRNSRRTSQTGRRDSRRASDGRRRSEGPGGRRWSADDEAGARDSGLLGPASSRMTAQTSQTSSLSPTTNAAVTPSTNQSDAFEFSSLVGSPESQSWEDAQEHLREDSLASSSPFDYSASPAMPQQNEEGEDEPQAEEVEDAQPVAQEDGSDAQGSPALIASPSLDAPAQIDTESFLRVPRNKPRRDPAATTSMLIRDVRNQATLATIALKKQGGPTSPPPSKPLVKSKSIRKGSISSPQLVSGPVAIPAVPIIKPEHLGSPRSNKVGRSKSRKDKDAAEGDAKKGLGLRFRMLLKKPNSRDQMGQLNGDEVTPFVDFDAPDDPSPGSAPVTPPNQDVARFDSFSPEFPQTPDTAPTPDHSRSPTYQPPSTLTLPIVEEDVERSSLASSVASGSPSLASPASGGASMHSRSLSRIMSRIRSNGRRGSDTSSLQQESLRNAAASPERTISPQQSPRPTPYSPSQPDRRPSIDQEVVGLGFEGSAESTSRAPASYHVGSPRARHRFENGGSHDVGTTAPLSPRKHNQHDSGFAYPPPTSTSRTSGGHATRASIDSMRKLWQAAEDLGLPPDKVQELVDSAYAQSPTTSSHAHSGSTSSTVGRRSSEGRRPSEASMHAHRRMGSTSSRKSVHDRVPTPPPAGRLQRQASLTSSRRAGPVPDLPSTYSSSGPSYAAQDASRLSVYSVGPSNGAGGSLAVPHSPSLGSVISRKSSEYANSFIDFYADDDDGDGDDEPGQDLYQDISPPPLVGRRPSLAPSIDEQLAMQRRREEEHHHHQQQEHTVRLNRIGEFEEQPNYRATLNATVATPDPDHGDEVVWQVLDDLRNNRLSTVSKDSSFGFDSRHSSMEVDREGGEGEGNDIANLLRHRDRHGQRTSASIPPWQQGGRYPSIYAKDEQRLLALGQQGGVAPETEGHFFVRPKPEGEQQGVGVGEGEGEGERVPRVPRVPEEYRGQWVGRH